MEVTVSYCPNQLESAVEYIAKNNSSFKNKHTYIRKSIHDSINEIAGRFPDLHSTATMGYIVMARHREEGIDQDMNHVFIEIYVDPGIGMKYELKDEDMYFSPKENKEA